MRQLSMSPHILTIISKIEISLATTISCYFETTTTKKKTGEPSSNNNNNVDRANEKRQQRTIFIIL